MTKVRIPSSSGASLRVCIAAIAMSLSLTACEQAGTLGDGLSDSGRFGDAYQVVTNVHPDAPDEPPIITSDSLYVQVSYSGGCENHEFDLDMETVEDTTRLWLRHSDGGDNCEALIHDRLAFELPDAALDSGTILLLNPNHDAPLIVR